MNEDDTPWVKNHRYKEGNFISLKFVALWPIVSFKEEKKNFLVVLERPYVGPISDKI